MKCLTSTVTLTVGQAVPWKPYPSGFAQVEDLRRTNVRIGYRTKKGTWRHRTVPVSVVALGQLLFQMDNPYNRGLITRQRRYEV